MNILKNLRFRIALSFTLLSLLCAVAYGLVSHFISKAVDDQLFNWYILSVAEEYSQQHDDQKIEKNRYIVNGGFDDLYIMLQNTFGLDKNNDLKQGQNSSKNINAQAFYAMSFVNHRVEYSRNTQLLEISIDNTEIHIVATPKSNNQYQFLIYDISGFSEKTNSISLISDHNAYLLIFILALFVTLIGLIIGLFMAHHIIAPLTRLANHVGNTEPEKIPTSLSRRLYPDEVGTLATTIEKMMSRIEAYVQREKRFSRDVSHELRTPVTSINIAIDLMKASQLDANQDKILGRVERANKDMAHLIETFMFLGRDDFYPHSESNINVKSLIDQAIEKNRHLLHGKPVETHIKVNEELEIVTSEQLFEIVIANLIRNAFQYTEQGSVTVVVNHRQIQVIDTGIGISAEKIDHIHKPYYKLNKEGMGLGLSIVQRILSKLGWHLHIESEKGKGTKIEVNIK